MKRLILALALALLPLTASAQAPPPVPALPDTQRLTSYSISGSTCACAVNFAIYGDGTDVDNWITVWINGIAHLSTDPTFGWKLSSPTGPLSSIARPITDAVLTFNAAQTGTVQIVGARRPRRVSQFPENRGITARDFNQALTDIVAQNRENWDAVRPLFTGNNGWPPKTQGNTNVFATVNGAVTSGHCIAFDGNGNLIDGGAPCVSASSGVTAGTANQLAYYATTGSVVSGLATGNNCLYGTNGSGVPSCLSALPTPILNGLPGGKARLWLDRSNIPHAYDMMGNLIGLNNTGICASTVTQCLQEFVTYTMQTHSQPALVTCYTADIVNFTGTVTNGSAVITGISPSTSSLGLAHLNPVTSYTPGGSSSPTIIAAFSQISTVDSSTQITLTHAATGSGTIGLTAAIGPDPQSGIFFNLGASIVFPPLENQDFEFNCGNATWAPTVLTSGWVFDSMMSSRVVLKGVFNYQPNTSCSCSTIVIAPRNPTFDGFITVGAGSFYASNPSTGNNSASNIKFDISQGEVRNGRFIFDEVLGGQDGIQVVNAGGSFSFNKNQIQASNVHGQVSNGIEVGSNGTTANYSENHWTATVEGVGSGSGVCFHEWSINNIIDLQCANANVGLQLQASSTNNSYRVVTGGGVSIPLGGDTVGNHNSGRVNGVPNANGAAAVNCTSGISASTGQASDGVVTHC